MLQLFTKRNRRKPPRIAHECEEQSDQQRQRQRQWFFTRKCSSVTTKMCLECIQRCWNRLCVWATAAESGKHARCCTAWHVDFAALSLAFFSFNIFSPRFHAYIFMLCVVCCLTLLAVAFVVCSNYTWFSLLLFVCNTRISSLFRKSFDSFQLWFFIMLP